jgi:hypothetical protein
MYSCWVKIPSLREMCFEALNYYVPDLVERDATALLSEGVPKDQLKKLHSAQM